MLWKMQWLRAALPLAAVVAVGCGDDSPTTPADTGVRDVPAADTPVTMDSGAPDTGDPQDTPAPEDTSAPVDTPAPKDTPAPEDSPAPEDVKTDAGPIEDTGPSTDTGPAVDAGCVRDDQCATGSRCCSGACLDTTTSVMNCGACGTACTAPSGTPTCVAGVCRVTGCAGATADCDMMASTGCETDTATSLMNCGACGTVCSFANAAATCATGTCGFTCNTGFGNCDSMPANGCETNTATSLANCGACGTTCTTPNAAAACTAGACAVGTCNDGFGNCNTTVADGCEVNLRTDRANCGMCGRSCGAGQSCAAGVCQFGNGSGGALMVSGTQTINTIRAGAAGASGATTVTLSGVVGTFAAGQEVLLHQTQAATGSVGQYEYARVTAATATSLTLAAPLVNTYTTSTTAHAQVVVVPEYTAVTVPSGATLTAPAWNGVSGGILVFDAGGAVTVAGTIDMSERGYRGNRRICGTTPIAHCMRGIQGEGERGVGTANVIANASGGGAGGSGQDCSSGAGGGYGTVGADGTLGNPGTCFDGFRGDRGLVSGTPSLVNAFLFGGAGGEGGLDEDGGYPGGGGHGGGAIVIRSTTLAVTGGIQSAGGLGLNGSNACFGSGSGMAGGGGGAGGTVRLIALTSAAVGTNRLTVTPGDGGQCTGGELNAFPGGNGGSGRIGVLSPMTTGTSSPAFNRE